MVQTTLTQKGRGAQINPDSPFERIHRGSQVTDPGQRTQYLPVHSKTVLNRVDSPDVPYGWSLNPYQGCEHGCVYCYARNTHPYWGYSSGMDFERKVLVKIDAPKVLEERFRKPSWKAAPIMLSGNTDCYQPVERKYRLTRQILDLCLRYRHPVSIVTKNSLIERDLDVRPSSLVYGWCMLLFLSRPCSLTCSRFWNHEQQHLGGDCKPFKDCRLPVSGHCPACPDHPQFERSRNLCCRPSCGQSRGSAIPPHGRAAQRRSSRYLYGLAGAALPRPQRARIEWYPQLAPCPVTG